MLLENIGETVDPVLDPLLGRNLIKKGRLGIFRYISYEYFFILIVVPAQSIIDDTQIIIFSLYILCKINFLYKLKNW